MENAIVTYIYPTAEKYLGSFINNLNDSKIIDECKLYIFNDNANIDLNLLSNLKMNFEIFLMGGSINKIRYDSFKILQNQDVKNIFFQDIDDRFSLNRWELLKEKLKEFHVVCNDLQIINYDTSLNQDNYWKRRLGSEFVFDYTFIQDKNIIGLGNTGIRKSLLSSDTFFSENPKAYDWFYFYQIIKKNNIKILFTSECQTLYLQHDNNIAGAGKINSKERIKKILELKRGHYRSLIEVGFQELIPFLDKIELLNPEELDKSLNFFWWEETNFLNKKQ